MKSKNKKKVIVTIVCSFVFISLLILQSKEDPEEMLAVKSGYYWSGMIDERERLAIEEEAKYLEDYLSITDVNQRVFDRRYNWIEISAVSAKHVQNGDYVQVYFTGPILELYPAKLQGVMRVDVVTQ